MKGRRRRRAVHGDISRDPKPGQRCQTVGEKLGHVQSGCSQRVLMRQYSAESVAAVVLVLAVVVVVVSMTPAMVAATLLASTVASSRQVRVVYG